MSSRPVATLQVRTSVRQIDAHESGIARYFGYLLCTAGLSWFLVEQTAAQISTGVPLVIAVVALLNLVLFRPWHLALNVDMDTASCRVEVRMFGMLPILRRNYELGDRRFAVERRHQTKKAAEGPGLGCLMMALPFPFSLLSFLFRGGSREAQHVGWFVMCLRGSEYEPVADLIRIRNRAVVSPLLEALRDLLPGHVE